MPTLVFALVGVVELARRLPLLSSFAALASASARVPRMLRRRCSEHWRERAMQLLSLHLFGRSATAGLLLAAAVLPLGLVLLADRWLPLGVTRAIADGRSRLLAAACTIGYALLRHAFVRHAARRRIHAR